MQTLAPALAGVAISAALLGAAITGTATHIAPSPRVDVHIHHYAPSQGGAEATDPARSAGPLSPDWGAQCQTDAECEAQEAADAADAMAAQLAHARAMQRI